MKHTLTTAYHMFAGCLCILTAVTLLLLTFFQRQLHVTYDAASFTPSTAVLQNPYCGFYQMRGYMLSDTAQDASVWAKLQCENTSCSLLLLEINLKNYSDTALSAEALQQLDQILTIFESEKKQLILRFLYDWEGNALQTEPLYLSEVKGHMTQLAEMINQHTASVYILQGLLIGDYGELQNSRFSEPEQWTELAVHLSEVTDPAIYLAVRTPAQLRSITQSFTPCTNTDAYSGTLISRLGLFNDGMLGSVYDLGTYDDTELTASSALSEKGTRKEELRFQNALCQYVPNGGEVTIDNYYNDLPHAIEAFTQMHISYLHAEYDPAVLNKWKQSVYEQDKDFPNANGYDYIQTHLGYRYVIQSSSLDFHGLLEDDVTLYLTIQNQGFAPAYRKFDTTLTLIDTLTKETIVLETDIDNRKIAGSDSYTFQIPFDIRSLSKGTYQIILTMTDPASELPIYFAQEGFEQQNNIPLATLTID